MNVTIIPIIIPKGSTPINLGYNNDGSFIWFKYTDGRTYYKELPNEVYLKYGEWKMLGFVSDISEEELAMILPNTFDKRRWSHLNDILVAKGIKEIHHSHTVLIFKTNN